jgi:glycine cleavage system H protein
MLTFDVAGYELVADRRYDPDTHMWVDLDSAGLALIGLDPLGRETSGDVVALSLRDVGTAVERGQPFGDLEAAKFVGPLIAPLSGTIVACNETVLSEPGVLNVDPAGKWLVAMDGVDVTQLDRMLRGESEVAPWFAAEVERFRTQGAIAE